MTGIVAFLWVCLLVVLASAKVTLQGRFSRSYFQNAQDPVFFNGILFFAIAGLFVLFFPLCLPSPLLMAAAASVAVFTLTFQITYASAMAAGPVSLTVLITNFSLAIPTLTGIVFYRESVYLTQLFGIAFLVLSMLLCRKSDKGMDRKISFKWGILAAVAMLSCGIATALQKVYGRVWAGVEAADTTLLALIYLFGALLAFLFYLVKRRTGARTATAIPFGRGLLLYSLAIAALLCVYQKCYMIAMLNIDSTVLFPTQSGLQLVLMTAIGVLLFKDKLCARQRLGIVFGCICVVLMNLPFCPLL